MKQCPECRRIYDDETLKFCLDDGSSLIYGPATESPATAILTSERSAGEAATRTFESSDTGVTAGDPNRTGFFSGNKNSLITGILGVLLLAALGAAGYWLYANRTSKQISSIAVMPFTNESGSADVDYLSDGMTETLISSLSQLPNLNVKARSTVFRYKGTELDTPAIGKQLNVQGILNGRVVQRGDGLTLYLELVDAQTGDRMWGEQYSRKQSDLVSLQTEIARDVASKLRARITGVDNERLVKNYTSNTEAYQLYLRGNFYFNKRGRKNIEKAAEYYQQAIAIDPDYALAYAGVADVYSQPAEQPGGMPKARVAALKALSLDNDLAEAHTALGRVLATNDYDFAGSEREFKRAIELNPNLAAAHMRYGALLASLGKFEAGEIEYRRALELEPFSLAVNGGYGSMLVSARRYDDAIAYLKKTLELDENYFLTHAALSRAYQLKGNYSESVEHQARVVEAGENPQNAAPIRESFAKGGWEGYLRYMTSEERQGRGFYDLARFYAALGDKDKAFAALNKSYDEREIPLSGIKVDPLLDPLRDDLRFQEVMKKMNFPE